MLEIFDFTPYPAIIGGAVLGTAAVTRLIFKGEVLGISGIVGRLVRGKHEDIRRWTFLSGLLSGGMLLRLYLPSSYGTLSISTTRAVTAGLLVGVGTVLGNGCTSGHGVCGLSRLSVRSFVATCTFMMCGFLGATLTQSTTAITEVPDAVVPSVESLLTFAQPLVAGFVGLHMALSTFVKKELVSEHTAVLMTDFAEASLFAVGLGIAGMTSATKVASFLDLSEGRWNPTLMFVMVGAIALNLSTYLGVIKSGMRNQTLLTSENFALPTNITIDGRLLAGAALFGLGWGVGGMCPGPALVSLASPHTPPLAFNAAMFTGFAFGGVLQ